MIVANEAGVPPSAALTAGDAAPSAAPLGDASTGILGRVAVPRPGPHAATRGGGGDDHGDKSELHVPSMLPDAPQVPRL